MIQPQRILDNIKAGLLTIRLSTEALEKRVNQPNPSESERTKELDEFARVQKQYDDLNKSLEGSTHRKNVESELNEVGTKLKEIKVKLDAQSQTSAAGTTTAAINPITATSNPRPGFSQTYAHLTETFVKKQYTNAELEKYHKMLQSKGYTSSFIDPEVYSAEIPSKQEKLLQTTLDAAVALARSSKNNEFNKNFYTAILPAYYKANKC